MRAYISRAALSHLRLVDRAGCVTLLRRWLLLLARGLVVLLLYQVILLLGGRAARSAVLVAHSRCGGAQLLSCAACQVFTDSTQGRLIGQVRG